MTEPCMDKRVVTFFVPGIPVTQGSMKAFIPRGWSRPIITHDRKQSLMHWRTAVGMYALQALTSGESGPIANDGTRVAVSLSMRFVLPRPKSLRNTVLHVKKPDLDKLTRAVMDALKGILYKDDSCVISITSEKHYGSSSEPCGCRITLTKHWACDRDATSDPSTGSHPGAHRIALAQEKNKKPHTEPSRR